MSENRPSSDGVIVTTHPLGWNRSPVERVMAIAIVVLVVEVTEPLLFRFLPPMSGVVEVLVDAGLMTLVLAPLLYVLFARRMTAQIQRLNLVETELRRVNSGLENLVTKRTEELVGSNRQLSRLIDEQRGTVESLNRTNRFVEEVFEKAPCLIMAFDANNRQCVYVNSRITDFLGYAQDDIAVTTADFIDRLVWTTDRTKFLAALKGVSNGPEGAVERGSCGFASVAGTRVNLAFGVTVLERTPTQQAKNLLLAAMPAAV